MAKFVTCMSFDTKWKHRWKPHVFWITHQNQAWFWSVFSLAIKIHGSKWNKLNTRTTFKEFWNTSDTQAMGRFSFDFRSLTQIRRNRIQGVDPYRTILKKTKFSTLAWNWKRFNQSNVQWLKPHSVNTDHTLDLSHGKYALLFLVHTHNYNNL